MPLQCIRRNISPQSPITAVTSPFDDSTWWHHNRISIIHSLEQLRLLMLNPVCKWCRNGYSRILFSVSSSREALQRGGTAVFDTHPVVNILSPKHTDRQTDGCYPSNYCHCCTHANDPAWQTQHDQPENKRLYVRREELREKEREDRNALKRTFSLSLHWDTFCLEETYRTSLSLSLAKTHIKGIAHADMVYCTVETVCVISVPDDLSPVTSSAKLQGFYLSS